jgi:hypothetical protein
MTVTKTWKRIITTVAIIGCLALVATVVLGLWLLFGFVGARGGTTSVGDTSVQYVSVSPDGRISLVIWSDLNEGAGQSNESDLFGSSAAGYFSSADGRRIDWEWKAPKEKGGDFQINGAPYELANGTLFLVSTKGGQVRVTQLDVDLATVIPDKQAFEALAKKDPRVARFIAEASGKK